jgi:TAG lipase/steryl ester hydrolase/phospholipase A2/LPA acyltransferase
LANRRRLQRLEKAMAQAESYDDWLRLAAEHDELSGMAEWRGVEHTELYDYAQIRLRLDRLRNLRAREDWQGLLFALNEGIHGNMGGMGKSVLYRKAKTGTKRLIEDYIDEIDQSLRLIAELPDDVVPVQQKLDFLYRCNVCFGRSGLMLSGGGVLGFLHLGVVNVLLEQGLMPRVISGSSAGSIVAGVLACHTDPELVEFRDPARIHHEARRDAGLMRRLLLGAGPQLTIDDVEQIVNRLIPDMTFEEAYAKTGRQVSITVAPAEPHQRSRLLNTVTSPNVFIRSAVMASCAVPGVFPPVMLMAKNVHGDPQPYLPGRRWVDGSVADDLPAKRLSRLFSTNHYIVSMVNPIATAFLGKDEDRGALSKAVGTLGAGVGREVLNFYRGIAQRRGDNWPRFNMMLHGIHSLLDQEYTGDINILPSLRMANPLRLLSHLTEDELARLVQEGERATYGKVAAIRRCTQISRTLDEILYRFEYGDLRPDPRKYRRPRSSRRRPPPTAEQLKQLTEAREREASILSRERSARGAAVASKRKSPTKAKAKSKTAAGASRRKTPAPTAASTQRRGASRRTADA